MNSATDSERTAANRAKACQYMSSIGRRLFKYIEFNENEEMIAEIRKHPIGVIVIAAVGSVVSIILAAVSFWLAMNLNILGLDTSENGSSIKWVVIGFGLLLTILALAVTAISVVLYRLNVVYVTNEKLSEVSYISAINRKVTQLSIGNVQDVTVSQQDIFSHIFSYGTLRVETAGEIPTRDFTFVPSPNKYSQIITEAHEEYVNKHGN